MTREALPNPSTHFLMVRLTLTRWRPLLIHRSIVNDHRRPDPTVYSFFAALDRFQICYSHNTSPTRKQVVPGTLTRSRVGLVLMNTISGNAPVAAVSQLDLGLAVCAIAPVISRTGAITQTANQSWRCPRLSMRPPVFSWRSQTYGSTKIVPVALAGRTIAGRYGVSVPWQF